MEEKKEKEMGSHNNQSKRKGKEKKNSEISRHNKNKSLSLKKGHI
jgi:hypothetical protein